MDIITSNKAEEALDNELATVLIPTWAENSVDKRLFYTSKYFEFTNVVRENPIMERIFKATKELLMVKYEKKWTLAMVEQCALKRLFDSTIQQEWKDRHNVEELKNRAVSMQVTFNQSELTLAASVVELLHGTFPNAALTTEECHQFKSLLDRMVASTQSQK